MSRPKEPPRIRFTASVLPETGEAITVQVQKTRRELNTTGKVLDQKFKPKKQKP